MRFIINRYRSPALFDVWGGPFMPQKAVTALMHWSGANVPLPGWSPAWWAKHQSSASVGRLGGAMNPSRPRAPITLVSTYYPAVPSQLLAAHFCTFLDSLGFVDFVVASYCAVHIQIYYTFAWLLMSNPREVPPSLVANSNKLVLIPQKKF
jgi:hypothetical protein